MLIPICQPPIHGPFPGPHNQEENGTQQHGPIRARFMSHAPETPFKQDWNLGGCDGDEHVNDEGNGRGARQKTQKHKSTARYFNDAHERRHDFRGRDPDLDESANAQRVRIEKLLNSLRKKDQAYHQPNENNRSGALAVNCRDNPRKA
jgi:hypothetical protein